MKRIVFSVLLLCSTTVSAQDVIVKKDGSTIISKVLEVNIGDIKYKKFSNQNGPTYTISKSEVMAVNYENGEKDVFNTQAQESSLSEALADQTQPRLIKRKTSQNNPDVVDSYNVQIRQTGQPLKKDASYITAFLGVNTSSVLSNEDLGVSFENVNWDSSFEIFIENKTDRVIYIDKGNCFRVVNQEPYCYYDGTEQTTVSSSSGGGASLGLGSVASVMGIGGVVGQLASGVRIGGGSSRSSATSFVTQRVIAIPPHSKRSLCDNKRVKINGSWFREIEPREEFTIYETRSDGARKYGGWEINATQFGLKKGDVKLGQVLTYEENNSPYQRTYTLTYSTTENFSTYSTINFTLYLRHVIGKKFWTEKGQDRIEFIKKDKVIECRNATFK